MGHRQFQHDEVDAPEVTETLTVFDPQAARAETFRLFDDVLTALMQLAAANPSAIDLPKTLDRLRDRIAAARQLRDAKEG